MSRLTRRTFVTILSSAAVAATVPRILETGGDPEDKPRSPWSGTTRWIGHC